MENVRVWTKSEILEKLNKNDKWLQHGIIAIYQRQTRQEQQIQVTVEHNQKGFSGADASYLSYIAKWLMSGRNLDGKHLIKARARMQKYAGQLAKIANGEL